MKAQAKKESPHLSLTPHLLQHDAEKVVLLLECGMGAAHFEDCRWLARVHVLAKVLDDFVVWFGRIRVVKLPLHLF